MQCLASCSRCSYPGSFAGYAENLKHDLELTFHVADLLSAVDTAAVDVYSILKFIEAGRDHMSSMGVAYDIDLVKIDGVWYITDVASNDHGF